MDALKGIADVFYKVTGFMQPSMFHVILAAVVAFVFVVSLLGAFMQGGADDTKTHYQKTISTTTMKLYAAIRAAAAALCVTSLLLFGYVFFRPMDARWAPTPITLDVSDVTMPDMPDVPYVGDALDGVATAIEGYVNQATNATTDKLNPKFDQINQVLAYVEVVKLMWPYLALAGLGIVITLFAWRRISRARKKAEKVVLEELANTVAAQDTHIEEQDGHINFLCDVLRDLDAESVAYRVQVKRFGRGHSLERGRHLPFTPDAYDYLADPDAYGKQVAKYYERKRAREEAQEEPRSMSVSTLLGKDEPPTT